ncbi:MAG: hypothetical protein NTU41_02425, partial [Chloroflexi bacterium]|nr:hypothetical protein [Chloroflexota bacterium]
MGGLPAIGGSRWEVCGKAPCTTPSQFTYGNFGGMWGAELKFAGWDAVLVQGRSDKPVYLLLDEGKAELRDASHLRGMGTAQTRETLKQELGKTVRVVAAGPAGENMAVMANLVADNDATGARGLGAVMGSKKLKAIAVRGSRKGANVAQPEKLRELTRYFRSLDVSLSGVVCGLSFKVTGPRARKDPCYGCPGNCLRVVYQAQDGQSGKYMCAGSTFYRVYADAYYQRETVVPFHANRLCNDCGLDLMSIDPLLFWLQRCYRAGILNDENTGMPLSKLGSLEFAESFFRRISFREGFGDVLSRGMVKAAEWVGQGAEELLPNCLFRGDQTDLYGPRLYITHALLYATEPRMPVQQLHEVSQVVGKWLNWLMKVDGAYMSGDVLRRIAVRFWGSETAADLSSYQGKALAAKKIQDREYAKECLGLCDYLWPIMDTEHTDDHMGDPTLESRILSAVTGDAIDEDSFNRAGEMIFNVQRAILTREGHRGRGHDVLPDAWHAVPLKASFPNTESLVPGEGGKPVSRKGAVVDRAEFEKMKDEYYRLRHWDVATGLQTAGILKELGLDDVAQDLAERGLLA